MDRIVHRIGKSLALKEFKYCNNLTGQIKNTRNFAAFSKDVCHQNSVANKKILLNDQERKLFFNAARELHFSKYLLGGMYLNLHRNYFIYKEIFLWSRN